MSATQVTIDMFFIFIFLNSLCKSIYGSSYVNVQLYDTQPPTIHNLRRYTTSDDNNLRRYTTSDDTHPPTIHNRIFSMIHKFLYAYKYSILSQIMIVLPLVSDGSQINFTTDSISDITQFFS